jgi:hypothetical protein
MALAAGVPALLLLLALGAAGGITCLALMVLFFVKGRHTPAIVFLVGLAASAVLVVVCVGTMVGRTVRGVGEGVINVVKTMQEMQQERLAAAEESRQERIERLKGYVAPDVLETVPPAFLTYGGFRDWWRIPLVYPYAIHCVDGLQQGSLRRHDGRTPIEDGSGEKAVLDAPVTNFSFDGRFLLIRSQQANTTQYVLFEFATGTSRTFAGREALIAEAARRGYAGDRDLLTVDERYRQYFEGEPPRPQPCSTGPTPTKSDSSSISGGRMSTP